MVQKIAKEMVSGRQETAQDVIGTCYELYMQVGDMSSGPMILIYYRRSHQPF